MSESSSLPLQTESLQTESLQIEQTSIEPIDQSSLPDSLPPVSQPPSYVKLAMRNMVRKSGKSLYHFALTTVGLLGLLVGLAYLTH